MSEAMPLDKAESKLLFSDDGVRAGLEVSPLVWVAADICRVLGELTESLKEA